MSKKKQFDADKTVLDVRRTEERELSERLYKNFQILNIMYPLSYDLQKSLAPDMFLRPNTKAFPFVMHYLFNILDPVEFKKRFYWPIDRTSENVFRTTTVQYLNYLNEKHNLGWGEVKAFLVVMPGGLKFMKLLADLIYFIVDEETRKATKSHPEIVDKSKLEFTEENVKAVIENHETFLKEAIEYKHNIESQKSSLVEKCNKLQKALTEICSELGLPAAEDGNENLSKAFAASNEKLFQSNIVHKVDDLQETEKYLDRLSSELDVFYDNKSETPFNKDLLLASYKRIQNEFPGHCSKDLITKNNRIDLEPLFDAFNVIFPFIENCLLESIEPEKLKEKFEFEENEVKKLESETMQFEVDILKIENNIEEIKSDHSNVQVLTPDRSHVLHENKMKTKFINTPSVCLENETVTTRVRLPLLDDNVEESFNVLDQTIVATKSTHTNRAISKIRDPIKLVHTMTKITAGRRRHEASNLSMLATRFKENQEMFVGEQENMSQTFVGIMNVPKTPVNRMQPGSTAKTTTARRDAIREKLIEGHRFKQSREYVLSESDKRTKSIGEANRNHDIDALSKSPLGRINPLLNMGKIQVPDIMLNDSPLDSSTPKINDFEGIAADIDEQLSALTENTESEDKTKIENKPVNEIDKFCIDFERKLDFDKDKELIFNVSDTLLNEVSF